MITRVIKQEIETQNTLNHNNNKHLKHVIQSGIIDKSIILNKQTYSNQEILQIILQTLDNDNHQNIYKKLMDYIAIPNYILYQLSPNKSLTYGYFVYYKHLINMQSPFNKIQTSLLILWINCGSNTYLQSTHRKMQTSCLLQLAKYIQTYYKPNECKKAKLVIQNNSQNYQPHSKCNINNKLLCLILCKHYYLQAKQVYLQKKHYDHKDLEKAFQCIYNDTIFLDWSIVSLETFITQVKNQIKNLKQQSGNLPGVLTDLIADYSQPLNQQKQLNHCQYIVIYNTQFLLLHLIVPKPTLQQEIRHLLCRLTNMFNKNYIFS